MNTGGEAPGGWEAAIAEFRRREAERDRIDWLLHQARGKALLIGAGRQAATTLAASRGLSLLVIDPDTERIEELADHSIDSILVDEALERYGEPDALLAELSRVATSDAVVAIVTRLGYSPADSHVANYLVASLLEVLAPQLKVESLTVGETDLRVLARPGAMDAEARYRVLDRAQPMLEARMLALQVETEALAAQVARVRARLVERTRSLRRQTQRARRLGKRLRRLRARRWRRLGAAPAALWARLRPAVGDPPGRGQTGAAAPRVEQPEAVEREAIGVPDPHPARLDLPVAAILGGRSSIALRHEWRQIELGPDDWRSTLEEASTPRLLFVESGADCSRGRWEGAIADQPARTLRQLVHWCRDREVPTVFWSNGSPDEIDRFVPAAGLFDRVFTTDQTAVDRFRDALGHDRVGLLQFACQPRLHNPIAIEGSRKLAIACAVGGSADARPLRKRLESIIEPTLRGGVDLIDVDGLDSGQLLAAYKRHKVCLYDTPPNAIPACPREVFELAASGTPVVATRSAGIEKTFGHLIPIASTPAESRDHLVRLLADSEGRERLAHVTLREVLANHTYGHRVAEVMRAVGIQVDDRQPAVTVIVPTRREDQIDHVIAQVSRQSWRPLQLVIALHGLDIGSGEVKRRARNAGIEDVSVLDVEASVSFGGVLDRTVEAADGEVVAKMDDDNLYGPNYLVDLVPALDYAQAGLVGKMAHYVYLEPRGVTILRGARSEHTYCSRVQGGTVTVRGDVLREYGWVDPRSGLEDGGSAEAAPAYVDPQRALFARCLADGVRIYSADRFSFASVRRGRGHSHSWDVSDGKQMAGARSISYRGPGALINF